MRVRTVGFLLILMAAATLSAQQSPTPVAPLTLADLERMAFESNPTLAAAAARLDGARQNARQAAAWPNPTIGYSADELRTGDEDRRGAHGVFAEQTIPLGGKLRLNRQALERLADETAIERDLQRARVTASVRRAFYGVLAADRRVEVHERMAALVADAVGVTAQLFNVGAADRPDFLEAEIESRRAQLEVEAARNRAFARRQELAAVVGRIDVAGRPLSGSLETSLPELERDAVLQRFLEQSPQIAAARAAVARAQAATAAARRETFPDLFVRGGTAYNRERGEDSGRPIGWEASVEAGVSVPIFNRNTFGIAAARAEESRAAAEVQRLELSLRAQLAGRFADYLTALRESESYRTEIMPKAEEAYRLYLARYRDMAAAYPQVLIAQRSLLELTARYLERLDEAWQTALDIDGFLAGDGLAPPGDVTFMGGKQ